MDEEGGLWVIHGSFLIDMPNSERTFETSVVITSIYGTYKDET